MEQSSCQSGPLPSDQSELDEDDSAFAKTPIRPDDDEDSASNASDISSASSDASVHLNNRGDRTYFHVWSDMLTCDEMAQLDLKAETEVPNYVEGDEIDNPNIHKPLSVDTSLPCPLIQFGPIPKRRSKIAPRAAAVDTATTATTGTKEAAPTTSELAGDINGAAAPSDAHNCRHHRESISLNDEGKRDESSASGACSSESGHDERCCDFSLVAAKNKARHKMEARLRRLERKRLVRF